MQCGVHYYLVCLTKSEKQTDPRKKPKPKFKAVKVFDAWKSLKLKHWHLHENEHTVFPLSLLNCASGMRLCECRLWCAPKNREFFSVVQFKGIKLYLTSTWQSANNPRGREMITNIPQVLIIVTVQNSFNALKSRKATSTSGVRDS